MGSVRLQHVAAPAHGHQISWEARVILDLAAQARHLHVDLPALAAFLARPGRTPRALLCANGNVTLAVTGALQGLGVRLGETGLLGIDELDWCELVAPGISTLAQPAATIGQAAVDSLWQRRDAAGKTPPRHLHYPPSLIPRGSTRLPSREHTLQERS